MRYSYFLATALASHTLARSVDSSSLNKRVSCGNGVGNCPDGQCCSEAGYCGKGTNYCKSPQCQIDYSNGLCHANQRPCGGDTKGIARNYDGDVPYNVIIKSCKEDGTVALTFDDGPFQYTSHVLDLLAQYNVKATFFIAGNNIGKGRIDDPSTEWPAIIRRIHNDGHQIGSHTWSHQDLSKISPEIREQQFIYNEMALRNVLGFIPKYMRPPYGSCTRASGCLDYANQLGYHVINWDVDTRDFMFNTPNTIQSSKDIIKTDIPPYTNSPEVDSHLLLSHDTQYQTAYNLTEFMIKHVVDKGFRAITVGECLGDSPENWYINAESSTSPSDEPEYCKAATTTTQVPRQTSLAPSKDGTCGARSSGKYTCKGSTYGNCCSYNGYCGKTSGYCDGGCQKDFGTCNNLGCHDKPIVSANGLCGAKFYQTCQGSTFGSCCSKNGYCGKTAEYCAVSKGCQDDFGTCT